MPAVNATANTYFFNVIRTLQARVRALETQQGFGVTDKNGNLRVRGGLLSNGDFGLLVSDPGTGVMTEFLPVYEAGTAGSHTVTGSTSGYTSTAGPYVEATIGANGKALLTVNSYIGVPGEASNQSAGFVGVSVDGAAPTGVLTELLYFSVSSTSGGAVGIAGNQSASVVLTTITPGQHTYRMEYKTTGPGTFHFRKRFLQVRPL